LIIVVVTVVVIVAVVAVVEVAVVLAVNGNGGSLTSGNKFGITSAVPVGPVGVEVVVGVEVGVVVVGDEVVKIGNGIIALSMIALCGGRAVDADELAIAVEAAAGVEVDTWHASPE
jgi:hypothetical protein